MGQWPYSESQDQNQQADSEMGASIDSRIKYINTNGQKLIQKFQIYEWNEIKIQSKKQKQPVSKYTKYI